MTMEYVTGGTMLAQSGSYVVRDADRILRERLMLGEFCYVLTPRQMGKSSLMVQTAFALRERGIASAILDLSKQGYNLDSSQWVNGLLEMLGDRLGLEAEIETFCRETAHSSPLQRWHRSLRYVVLEKIPGRVVIFLDEIDITRRLRFETDEFFAAIRACYNARSDDPAYRRLTFCLLGVATPADLVRDPLLTPFNIGTRIDLRDFTSLAAAALQQGLGGDEATNHRLMERIYYWTHGHPYLTQRLCKAVAQNSAFRSLGGVDQCCQEIFLDSKAGSTEDNLTFVRRRLAVEDPAQRANLLTLYQQVLSGKRIADNDADATVAELKLSGAVRSEEGFLIPRNRIYRSVFNSRWIGEHMPDAELRRQRAAYRHGVFRAAMVSALLFLAVLGSGATFLYFHAREGKRQQEFQRRITETKRRYFYIFDIAKATQALDNNNYMTAFKSLERERPATVGEIDYRAFEWRYLWQKSQGDRSFFACPEINVFAVAVSPDGRFVAAGGQAKEGPTSQVRLWEIATRRNIASFSYPGEVKFLAFSPDSKILAAGGGIAYDSERPGSVYLWDRTSGRRSAVLLAPHQVNALAFSQDGKRLSIVGAHGHLARWEIASHQETVVLPIRAKENLSLAISKDEKTLAVGTAERVFLYGPLTGKSVRALPCRLDSSIYTLAFSPDNSLLAVGGDDGAVQIRDVKTWTLRREWKHPGMVSSLAFSPDGRTLATACWDDTIRLWDVVTGHLLHRLIGHIGRVNSVAFTPDGRTLVSGANDGTVRLWDVDPKHALAESIQTGSPVCGVALSDDARTLATTDGETMRFWDAASGKSLGTPANSHIEDKRFRFSPDGRMLASVSWGVWNPRVQAHRNSLAQAESSALLFPAAHPVAEIYSVTMKDMILRRRTGGLVKDIIGVNGLALAPDGDTVAVIGRDREPTKYGDGTLELWSLRTRQWLGAVRGAHSNYITALAFSRDGKRIASGGWDHKVRIWEVSAIRGMQDGREGHRTLTPIEIEDQGAQVFAIAFTRDNKTVAIGTEDSKVRLCSLETKEVIVWLSGHQEAVTSLAFSYDDNLLVSGSVDGSARFWRAASFARTDDPMQRKWYKVWGH